MIMYLRKGCQSMNGPKQSMYTGNSSLFAYRCFSEEEAVATSARQQEPADEPPQFPLVFADIQGGPLRPEIRGIVYFLPMDSGTQVYAYVTGLPPYTPGNANTPPIGPHGFHIHSGGSCAPGDPANPFQDTGDHWNPTNQPHGNHAGDFPPLFSNDGVAFLSFYTDKFTPTEVVGKTIIIHENPDDFRTQPSGNSGKRLACGVIVQSQTRTCTAGHIGPQ